MAKRRQTPIVPAVEGERSTTRPWIWAAAVGVILLGIVLAYVGSGWYGPIRPPVDVAALHKQSEQIRSAYEDLVQAQEALLDGRAREALQLSEQAVEVVPQEVWAHLLAATAALELRMYTRSEQAYRKVLELDPQNIEALISLGSLAVLDGKLQDARKLLESAVRQVQEQGGSLGARMLIILAAANADRPERAREHIRLAIKEDKDLAIGLARSLGSDTLGLLGEVLSEQGMYADAAEAFAAAATGRADRPIRAAQAAELYFRIGNLTSASAMIDEALQVQPDNPAWQALQRQIYVAQESQRATSTMPTLTPPPLLLPSQ